MAVNFCKLHKKASPNLRCKPGDALAEAVGFEPTCPCGQPHFECGSLRPLRYTSIKYSVILTTPFIIPPGLEIVKGFRSGEEESLENLRPAPAAARFQCTHTPEKAGGRQFGRMSNGSYFSKISFSPGKNRWKCCVGAIFIRQSTK